MHNYFKIVNKEFCKKPYHYYNYITGTKKGLALITNVFFQYNYGKANFFA